MPVIHQYVNKKGFYVKSAFEGNITTYQVSGSGEEYMRSRGYHEGTSVSVEELMWMKRKGYIYSGGSGPGAIDSEQFYLPSPPRKKTTTYYKTKPKPKRKRKKSKQNACCCGLVLPVMALPFAGFTVYVVNRKLKSR